MTLITSRAEWLASLKVGDEVGVSHRYQGRAIVKVGHVTPTRRIVLDLGPMRGTLTFDASGHQYPNPRKMDAQWSLCAADDNFRALVLRQAADAEMRDLLRRLDAARNTAAPAGFDYTTHNAALRACLDALGRKP